ncbi:MAG: transglycosylase SLT domain-containing protein [Anaeromyxobacteraceae bacterium]
MHGMIDFTTLGLRDAYDFAIMIEEDALLRYQELAALLGSDAGGAGDVCRAMVEREHAHRSELLARRASLFRGAPPRLEISVLEDGVERPDVDDDALPRTAREALEVALAAERRAHAFFASSLEHLADPATRAFFRQLMDEEGEHARDLASRIAALPVQGGSAIAPRAHPVEAPPCAVAPVYPDRALLAEALPRFDAATRAVAEGVIVAGRAPREVAEALGVSGRTVRRKLSRFVELARQHLAIAAATAALAGCAGNLSQAASAPREVDPAATQARRVIPDRSEAEQRAAAEERARSDRAALAKRVHRHVAARMPAESPGLHTRLARAIVAEAERARLDPFLVLALIHTESSFDPRAISEAGARGLMQLLEPTMRLERARAGLPPADPHDPVANVQAGVRYLRRLVDAFGDVDSALMAYNAGPSRIRKHLRRGAVPARFQVYPQRVHGEVKRLRVAAEEAPPAAALPSARG